MFKKPLKDENGDENFIDSFSMTCFSPAFLFKMILDCNPISLILTSGTLSPMNALDSDLGVFFVKESV
jgi:hypothetical protein